MARLVDFCRYNGFIDFAKKKRKYREFYKGHEAIISMILSVLVAAILLYIDCHVGNISDICQSIFSFLIPSMIGLLGFLIAGLALMASIITTKAVETINKINKVERLAAILYSFYFEAGIVGFSVVVMIILYLFTYISLATHWFVNFLLIFLVAYPVFFSLIYAVELLGTCINFFFLNVYYSNLSKN